MTRRSSPSPTPASPAGPASGTFWRRLLGSSVARECPTPFYAFSLEPIQGALRELDRAFGSRAVRHWLSFKTLPLPPLIRWWRQQDRDIEVVSAYEFEAALAEGFPAHRILANGPAKQRWLQRHRLRGLNVNFDSVAEARALAPLARELDWRCGLRLLTREEYDPAQNGFAAQFGLIPDEVAQAVRLLQRARVRLETVHVHLRSNVDSPAVYERALTEAAATCQAAGFSPLYVDCGGGFPAPDVWTRSGQRFDARFTLPEMARVHERVWRLFPAARELWLENGRWLSGRAGVLVVTVLEAKQRGAARILICDGGRTMNALMSTWEQHAILTLPPRRGAAVTTSIHGPTCMAFDQLIRCPLPKSVRPGDRLVWMDAGAYHLPWESRFSHGLGAILWHEGPGPAVTQTRPPESFEDWWASWQQRPSSTP